jgi:hypothetical protein
VKVKQQGFCEGSGVASLSEACASARESFSPYLDGLLDGRTMKWLGDHLDTCLSCHKEFHAWRSVQSALADLGTAQLPGAMQAQLRDALAGERVRGTYLSPFQRFSRFWTQALAPACMRFGAGLAAALVLVGSATWFIGSAAPVQANDDRLADLHPPRFLYSEIAPEPIPTRGPFIAVLVDAKVDAAGRVYDYSVVQGPQDSHTRARIESNLLGSVFKPATIFGVPVPGHAMMTYTTVSVHG